MENTSTDLAGVEGCHVGERNTRDGQRQTVSDRTAATSGKALTDNFRHALLTAVATRTRTYTCYPTPTLLVVQYDECKEHSETSKDDGVNGTGRR
jgi:hypothetical protein